MEHVRSLHILGAAAWKERSVSIVRVIYPRKEHKKGNKQTKTNVAKIEETLLLK